MQVYILKKNGNKYLIFDDSVDENKATLKKYVDLRDGTKKEIKTINGGEQNNYGKLTWNLNLVLTLTCH